ncbi:MAG TPA: hypothetical protein VNM90_29415, partial [Haliangium sp.]|nr:hypothetical protein [Haliangium sp.]
MNAVGSKLLALAIGAVLPSAGCLEDERLQSTRRSVEQLTVSSTANIFGAGHASPPNPGGGGAGTLPPSVAVSGGTVTFPFVTGMISCCGPAGMVSADGGSHASGNTDITSYQGISGITHTGKTMFLVGVFLDDAVPSDPAPAALDVSDWNQQTSFAPQLRQTFFIGDGLSAAGALQSFEVPDGATRLFLGFADALEFGNPISAPGYYHDNVGSLSVSVEISDTVSVPPAPVVGPLVDLFNEGCSLIRDSAGHSDQRANERGADYQIAAEPLGDDPLTRERANMERRVVRALASGRIIDVVRLSGNPNRTSVTPTGLAVQAAEEQGILINVLSENATDYLLIQYVHVFPTFDWVGQRGGYLDLPSIVEYDGLSADTVA